MSTIPWILPYKEINLGDPISLGDVKINYANLSYFIEKQGKLPGSKINCIQL